MKNVCLECGAAIIGRSDKKFCNDMCRNSWHNRIYREQKNLTAGVNSLLASNRRILKNLYDTGMRKVSRRVLEEEKFDFGHFTSFSRNYLGRITYRCYEYEYYSDLRRNITISKE